MYFLLSNHVHLTANNHNQVLNPIIGFGYESFWLGDRLQYMAEHWGITSQAHNGYLEMYLNMHPGDTSVMFPLAALYMKDGKFEESKNILLNLLSLDENHKDAANLLEEVEHSLAQVKQVIRTGAQTK